MEEDPLFLLCNAVHFGSLLLDGLLEVLREHAAVLEPFLGLHHHLTERGLVAETGPFLGETSMLAQLQATRVLVHARPSLLLSELEDWV